ncbi:HD-GYP domain-containing protein [Thalassolituus sp. LLYu03]|uniref:HD-GYP domain-containing protein n=1 Tax=Thalassolituus sp. LLYu03 TaxID=3421656 RepID=UPI003D2C8590
MASVARIHSPAVTGAAQDIITQLVRDGVLVASDAASADLLVVPAGQACPAHRADAFVLTEADAGHIAGANEILLPPGMPPVFLRNALTQALRLQRAEQAASQLQQSLQQQEQQLERLMQIGLALSAEQDHPALLARILTEARRFAHCDAASIFLIEEKGGEAPELVFKLTQNDSVALDFTEQRFPLNTQSLAGFAAIEGQILNFDDVYAIPDSAPYHFNQAFDHRIGYRTRSMLVIPMRTHDGRVTGVIQFLNRKKHEAIRLTSPALCEAQTIPFDEPLVTLLETLASQAAVAIENNLLVERINMLFEGFVRASVRAIEQRDPTTSGHSFRVAELTVALAEATDMSRLPALQAIRFTLPQLRELRYAALLHDFGKVGVREHVLVKAKKLSPEAWLRFQFRMDIQHERVKNRFLTLRLEHMRAHTLSSALDETLAAEEASELARIQSMRSAVSLANEPSVLDEDTFGHLQAIRQERFTERDGRDVPLLDEDDFLSLAVKRGSLTLEERQEIESHVTHTINFLATIPWTPELSGIPSIAGAHHEKLDGTGYPFGLSEPQIPPGAKIMAVCDIFDALTASDRPYKPALPVERALDILNAEGKSGKIDQNLVRIFTELPLTHILPSLKSL